MLMRYESEINLSENGQVELITRGKGWKSGNRYLDEYNNKALYIYPSVDELRKSLIREKFYIEAFRVGGSIAKWTGIGLVFTTPFSSIAISSREQQMVIGVGVSLFWCGKLLNGYEESNKPKVNSQIEAFNQKFPDLKPITFNPRDYLSTIKIPFHR